jgi:hypothetical protein
MPDKITNSRPIQLAHLKTHGALTSLMEQFKYWEVRTRELSLTAFLIVEALLIFVALPLEAKDQIPGIIAYVMVVLFVITSFIVALQSYKAIIILMTAVIASQIIAFIYGPHSSPVTDWCDAAARHTAICAVSWVIAKSVLKPGRISIYRIEAAIALYLNIGLFFFTTYRLLLSLVPGTFLGLTLASGPYRSGSELLYFSFASLVASGYRRITPVGSLAHTLVNAETLVGLLYPIAILIWFVISQKKQGDS